MYCPQCGYPQECPCVSCVKNFPSNTKRWINLPNDFIKCASCGYTAHRDKWGELYSEYLEQLKMRIK